MTDAEKQAEIKMQLKQIAAQIETYGVAHVVSEASTVFPLNYVYTVGRTLFNQPELILFRQSDTEVLGSLFGAYGSEALPPFPSIGGDKPLYRRDVLNVEQTLERYMPVCKLFFEGIMIVDIQQIIIPDTRGRFMPHCDKEFTVPLL